MERISVTPRPDWRERCDRLGFSFYDMESEDGQPYWSEGTAYAFSPSEIAYLEATTGEIFNRSLDAAEYVVRQRRYAEFGIPAPFWDAVGQSWDQDDPNVYQRYDLAYNGIEPAKLLEFNADTPTSLIESSVIQWHWMREVMGPNSDQFNNIHDLLVEQWKFLRQDRWHLPEGARLHLACLHSDGEGQRITEDFDNTAYMAEPAKEAGFEPKLVYIEDIGWDPDRQCFVDADEEPIEHIFKLYPWEWMANEPFGDRLLQTRDKTQWVEPLWKMLWSNKQFLVVMHQLFPTHPNILPTYNDPGPFSGRPYVQKPKLSREGANVTIYGPDGRPIESADGDYGEEGHVYQAKAALGHLAGKNFVIGSWVIGAEPAGIDIRETTGLITGDLAMFVPHFIR